MLEESETEGDNFDKSYTQSVELYVAAVLPGEPLSYRKAIEGADVEQWKAAMNEELDSLESMDTWVTVPRPEDRAVIGCKWVFRIKRNADGSIARYKARLVARRFTQVYGLDYDETYAPVTRLETIRLLFTIAVEKDWEVRQIDVKTAYLYGELDEEIFMEPPEGYEVPEGHVLKLQKALYGLKQAGRQWYKKLRSVMGEFGLKQIPNDPHTFVGHKVVKGVKRTLILPIYVDDLLPIGDKVLTDEFEAWIPQYFDVTPASDATLFLGIRITRDRTAEAPYLILDQHNFAKTVLQRFEVEGGREVSTPLPADKNLVPKTTPDRITPIDIRGYQSVIGSLMYLMLGTRPDLAYAVGKLSRFSSNPSIAHFEALDRVLKYLFAYPDLAIKYEQVGDVQPEAFVDADYAGDTSDRKSTAGYAFFMAGAIFSWSSKKEPTIATSTMEAEYIALFFGAQQAAWIWQFQELIGFTPELPITIWCDSKSAIDVAKAEASHKRAKHIDVKFHSIRERISDETILVRHVSSKSNCADVFTKSLGRDIYWKHVEEIGMTSYEGNIPEDLDLSFMDVDTPPSSPSPGTSSSEDSDNEN